MKGRLRPIAVTSAKRIPAAPDVPTVAESGVPDYDTVQWNAMVAPRATPRGIVDRLSAEVAASAKSPGLLQRLAAQGMNPTSSTPEQLGAHIKTELSRYGKLIKSLGIKDE